MVKCADCGFLELSRQNDGVLVEANAVYRAEGFQGWQKDEVFPTPICFVREQPIHLEPMIGEGFHLELVGELPGLVKLGDSQGGDATDKAILSIITKERECPQIIRWR